MEATPVKSTAEDYLRHNIYTTANVHAYIIHFNIGFANGYFSLQTNSDLFSCFSSETKAWEHTCADNKTEVFVVKAGHCLPTVNSDKRAQVIGFSGGFVCLLCTVHLCETKISL